MVPSAVLLALVVCPVSRQPVPDECPALPPPPPQAACCCSACARARAPQCCMANRRAPWSSCSSRRAAPRSSSSSTAAARRCVPAHLQSRSAGGEPAAQEHASFESPRAAPRLAWPPCTARTPFTPTACPCPPAAAHRRCKPAAGVGLQGPRGAVAAAGGPQRRAQPLRWGERHTRHLMLGPKRCRGGSSWMAAAAPCRWPDPRPLPPPPPLQVSAGGLVSALMGVGHFQVRR